MNVSDSTCQTNYSYSKHKNGNKNVSTQQRSAQNCFAFPVNSTGHLTFMEKLFGLKREPKKEKGKENKLF